MTRLSLAVLLASGWLLSPATAGALQADSATVRVLVVTEGIPLAEARVQAGGASQLTDASGRARLRVRAGDVVVTASRIGYFPAMLTLRLA
ncbi:MAG: hypothetical protein KJZ47_13635, partial [Gemmatimonadales bacterium]|nr:hypothetical protein [Gemmatimonadales bacterium]